jgi:hypothetical protein
MATVTTSTAIYATADGRHTGVTADGTIWVMSYNLANTCFEFWYSTNTGASFSEATSLRYTSAANRSAKAEFHIGAGDRACFANGGSGGVAAHHTLALTSSASWTQLFTSNDATGSVRCRAHLAKVVGSTGTAVSVLYDHGGRIRARQYFVSTDVVFGGDIQSWVHLTGSYFDFDFAHTGDGKTTLGAGFCYVVYRQSDGTVAFRKSGSGAYGFSSFDWSSTYSPVRSIDATAGVATDPIAGVFDGSRFIMSFVNNGGILPSWYERNAGDTATTNRSSSVPALSDGAVTSLSMAVDSGNFTYLFGVGTTSDDVKVVKYDRAAGTFGSWSTVAATTATADTMSVSPSFTNDAIEVVWTSGSGPYDIVHAQATNNQAPLAPTWTSPGNNTAQNINDALVLDWAFVDPNTTDTQSAYSLSRSVNGGALAYWRASDSSWQASVQKNTSGTSAVTLASGWAADGDSTVYAVLTYDAADVVGPYSSGLTVIGSVPVTPVLTAPTDAGTITTNRVTVTWTATEQTAYRVRILNAAGSVQLYDTGKVTSTVKTLEVPYVLANNTTFRCEVRVWNDDDLVSSAVDTHTFSVAFVAPATPTLAVTAQPADGRIRIVVTDPTPSGEQPTVDSHDLFVRVAAGTGARADGERPVAGAGIRIAAGTDELTIYDYAAGSGIDYEYLVRSIATTNGASADSAWT